MSYFVQVPTGPDPRVERRSAHFGEPLLPERWAVTRATLLGLKFVCGCGETSVAFIPRHLGGE